MRIYCLASFLDPGKITGKLLLDCENPLKMWWVLINNVLGSFYNFAQHFTMGIALA